MKKNRFIRLSRVLSMAFAVAGVVMFQACVPTTVPGEGDVGEEVLKKPDPTGSQEIGLFYDSGDNLAGLYYSSNGFLTSTTSDWALASVGYVPGLGNVEYIPTTGWRTELEPYVGQGFVGWHPSQGFTRFYVAAVVRDHDGAIVGVGLRYLGSFRGYEEPLELTKTSLSFDAAGGEATIRLKGEKYSPYHLQYAQDWLVVQSTFSAYKFINDVIEFTVSPNTSAESREAVITLMTTNGKQTKITVTQAGAN